MLKGSLASMPAISRTVFVLGMCGIALGTVGIRIAQDLSWVHFFDNLHWTSGTLTAATLAWLSLRKSESADIRGLRWMAYGLTGYASGQILWDIQTVIGYTNFPAPSDLFYLWLGPCVTIGLLRIIQDHTQPAERKAIWMDALTLTVAIITLILVLYLPKRGETALLPLLILIAYPATLFAALCTGLAMIPALRLKLNQGLMLFLTMLAATAASWMNWNFLALDGIAVDGAWFNVTFSIGILLAGFSLTHWQIKINPDPKWDRRCEGTLRLLPLVAIIVAAFAEILSHNLPDLPLIVQYTTDIGTGIVILLALIRQANLLKERDLLVTTQQELIKIQNQASRGRGLLKTLIEAIPDLVWVKDPDGVYLTCNPTFERLYGHKELEIIGKSDYDFVDTELADFFRQHDLAAIEAGKSLVNNEWLTFASDGYRGLFETIKSPMYDEKGQLIGVLGVARDITQLKQSEEVIWKQANFDPLTQLPNRRLFTDRLEQEILKAHRSHHLMALLFIDLDRFKEVNDTMGHQAGDLLLTEAAKRISTCVRETDTVARLGGDEFTVILPELENPAQIDRVAEAILSALNKPFIINQRSAFVSGSIGITLFPDDAASVEGLLMNADQAMYQAKNLGRNRYYYFTSTLQKNAQERSALLGDLRLALAGHQFCLHYQPIVEMATGQIFKAEALIRWNHPTRGLVSPVDFIPLAEETGLISDIGDWVFNEAANCVQRWAEMTHSDFQISINKSPVQFQDSSARDYWLQHLHKLGLSGKNLNIEITEGLLLEENDRVADKLLKFRDAGIQVSIDDFGTGYSALSYLNKFDIDYLKIDQSFTRQLAPGSNDLALSEAIIVMAHKLGLKVVAEGVETAEQHALLLKAGCDFGQGYFYAKPMQPEEFEQLLKKQQQLTA